MKNKFSMALSLAVIFAMIAATFALADEIYSDGDGFMPIVDTPSLHFGNVCNGSTTTKTVLHGIRREGNGQVFANNATVNVFITSVIGAGLNASGGGTIVLPSTWVSIPSGANFVSQPVASIITFVAGTGPTPRSLSGQVGYTANGPRSGGGTVTRTDTLIVTATVVNCDTTPPTLNLPGTMIVEATDPSGAVIEYTVTATDTNPLNPPVDCYPASGLIWAVDSGVTISCYAIDAAGNVASGSFFAKVVDTTPPAVTPPSDIVVEAAGSAGAVVSYSGESASDLVDGEVAVSCEPASGSTFPLGLNTVTCSATDAHNNTGSSSFTIDVQDTVGPILALPTDITEEATSVDGAVVNFTASASDVVDGDVDVSCDWEDGDTFPLGTTLVSCSATDSNNNTSDGSFNVTVVDTTAPELALPVDFAVEAIGASGAAVTFSTSAFDLVDGDVAVSCTPASGATFPLGATTVNCYASDDAGNTATDTFTITVQDTTPPALIVPADQQLEATGLSGAQAFFTASATDTVDGALDVTCSANSGDTFPLGNTTVNCSVSDAAGNEASGSFVIIVEDTIAPTIAFVNRTAANVHGWNNDDVTVNWSCSDIVGVIAPSVSQTLSSEGENQSATGTCTDTSGNTASDTQSGINIDKTKPSTSATRAPLANANGWNNIDVTVSFSGTDDRSGIDSCSSNQVFGEGANQFASGTCTDKAGNVSDVANVSGINVDKTAPIISGAPDRDANANGWYNADVTVSFDCDDLLSGVNSCTDSVTLGEGANQGVPGSVTDLAGNSANTTVNGINIDKTAPVITAALDIDPVLNGWFNISTGAPTVSFLCSDALSGLAGDCPADHTFGDGANQSYSQTIYDLAGNSASDGVSDVDVDTVAPSISVVLDRAAAASGWFNISTGAPVAEFTCSDGTSGIDSCPADYTFSEGENQSRSGTAYDVAGNSASASVNDVDIDLTAPAVTLTPERGTDHNGWYNAPVSFSFDATDSTSLVDACTPDVNYSGPDSATANVSGSCSDNAGNTGSSGVTFKYDNTVPSISASVSPTVSSYGWWNLSTGAPTATFTCGDGTSGVESCAVPHLFGNGENQSFTGNVTDNAGNTNSASVNNIDVDLIVPSISAALDGSPAASGWFNASTGAPTVEFSCSDTGSSGLAYCPSNHLFGEGENQMHGGTASDIAGNTASAGVSNVDVDTVVPSISVALDRSPAATGWFNEVTGAPVAEFTCSDATSGVVACPADYTFGNGENQTHSGTLLDNAGNSNSASVSNVDVDLVDPSLTWTGGPTNGSSFYFGSVPAAPTCAAADALSGANGCAVSGYGTTVGSHTVTAAAQDVAGNEYTEQRTYTVLAWTLHGFYQPVDMNGVFNTVRNGSTVPLKFELLAGSTELTDVAAINTLTYAQVACNGTAPQDEIETVATGGTVLRYDATSGQFIFNWKTPSGTSGKCFRVTMNADDGSTLVAYFKMK